MRLALSAAGQWGRERGTDDRTVVVVTLDAA